MRSVLDSLICRMVQTLLVPRSEGDSAPIPAPFADVVSRHIDGCDSCRSEIKCLRMATVRIRKLKNKVSRSSDHRDFASRVMDRVRREDELQTRVRWRREAVYAVVSGTAVLITGLTILGGFRPLYAEWFQQTKQTASNISPAHKVESPFIEHDPFQPINRNETRIARQLFLKNVQVRKAAGMGQLPLHKKVELAIPDFLPRITTVDVSSIKQDIKTQTPALVRDAIPVVLPVTVVDETGSSESMSDPVTTSAAQKSEQSVILSKSSDPTPSALQPLVNGSQPELQQSINNSVK